MKNSNRMAMSAIALVAALASSVGAFPMHGFSAKAEGVGFAYSVFADEPLGIFYNPAGISFISGWQTQVQYGRPSKASVGLPNESPYFGAAAVNYYNEGFGNLVISGYQFGSTADPTRVVTTSTASLALARVLAPGVALGTGVVYVFESNYAERTAFDFNAGLAIRPKGNFQFAAAAENFLRSELTPAWQGHEKHLDRRFRLGSAYLLPGRSTLGALLAGWQITQAEEPESKWTSLFNLGSEWWFARTSKVSLAVRGGYTLGRAITNNVAVDHKGWHAGLSVNFSLANRDFRIDYGLRQYPLPTDAELPVDHFVSLCYGFGGVPDYGMRSDSKGGASGSSFQLTDEAGHQPIISPLTVPPGHRTATGHTPATAPQGPSLRKLDLSLDAADISTLAEKRIVFYIRQMAVLKLNAWRLYIFRAKLSDWSWEKADQFSLHQIDGRGIPPINVIWNGVLADGSLARSGKYYFVITGEDNAGNRYISDWCKFSIK